MIPITIAKASGPPGGAVWKPGMIQSHSQIAGTEIRTHTRNESTWEYQGRRQLSRARSPEIREDGGLIARPLRHQRRPPWSQLLPDPVGPMFVAHRTDRLTRVG